MSTLNEMMTVDCLTATRSDEIFRYGLKRGIYRTSVNSNKTPCHNDGNLWQLRFLTVHK